MKRHAKLLIMLGLLTVLIVGAVIQKQFFPSEREEGLTDPGSSVTKYATNDIVAENVKAFSFSKGDVSLFFVKEGDAFKLEGENTPNIYSEKVLEIIKAVAGISASNRVESVDEESLTLYGLDSPSVSFTVRDSEKTKTYIFGDYNKTVKEYYFCEKGANTVFTVPSSAFEAFDVTLEDVIVHDTLEKVEADSINSFTFENASGKTEIIKIKTPTDENDEGYNFSAEIVVNGKRSDYSYSDFYNIAEEIAAWNINEFVTADNNKASEYGFDSPSVLTITYTERQELEVEGAGGGYIDKESTLTLYLGSVADDGLYYCKTSESSPLIYKLSALILSETFEK